MAGKSTRITVDLGDADLAKAVRIAAVESGRTVRDIVVEALLMWLQGPQQPQTRSGPRAEKTASSADTTDYRSMIETLSKYREEGNR